MLESVSEAAQQQPPIITYAWLDKRFDDIDNVLRNQFDRVLQNQWSARQGVEDIRKQLKMISEKLDMVHNDNLTTQNMIVTSQNDLHEDHLIILDRLPETPPPPPAFRFDYEVGPITKKPITKTKKGK